jgi:hypothetical protein
MMSPFAPLSGWSLEYHSILRAQAKGIVGARREHVREARAK